MDLAVCIKLIRKGKMLKTIDIFSDKAGEWNVYQPSSSRSYKNSARL